MTDWQILATLSMLGGILAGVITIQKIVTQILNMLVHGRL